MSHLIIEKGQEVGKEVSVPATGIKFGRSPANDLVLEDESLMLFQGRFFFKSDGTLWVTDFSVGEKAKIGGIPVDEQQLKMGDLVEVGSTAFRVISVRQDNDVPISPAVPVKDEEIDLGFKPHQGHSSPGSGEASEKRATPMYRVLQVLVVLLLLLIVVVGASEFMRSKNGTGSAGVQMKGLFLRYERVEGSGKNIFRYAFQINPDGEATLRVDDARNRHFVRSTQLTPVQLRDFKAQVEDSRFFEIAGDRIGHAPGKYNLCDIALACDGEFNHVRVLNREMPIDMRQVKSDIENFAVDALDISLTFFKDDATLIRFAQEAYETGAMRYKERDADYGNLAMAIKNLKEARAYLELLEPKPDPYDKATELLERAQAEQAERYNELEFDIDRAIRVGNYTEAQRKLRIAAELVPDRSDERYERIASKMLEVEAKLR